jgi:hypothetical protein
MTSPARPVPPGVDATKPSQARTYDYVLGGTHNYEVDRRLAASLTRAVPELIDTVWANRGFHQRAARYIARQGVSQFIDIGAGLPTVGNTHEVVQQENPQSRVVYTDIDPAVLAHASEMLTGDSRTVMIEGDVQRPDEILGHPDLRRLIDFTQPVGLLITAVLHAVPGDPGPARLIARYLDAFPSGSYLALSHMTTEAVPPLRMQTLIEAGIQDVGGKYPRTRAQVREIFAGLEMVAPYPGAQEAVTWLGLWGCEDPEAADSDGSRWACCGVGRKP